MHETLDEEQTAYVVTAVSESRRRPYCTRTADAAEGSRRAVAVARSRRKKQSLKGMRRRVRNNGFRNECRCVYFVRNVGRSLRGTLAGLRCGRLRPAWLEEPNDGDSKSFARAGCDRPTSTTLLCHSERSEESFPLRTKGRGRTMPRKEEKDKRSAVKNLSTYTFIQILRRSSDLLRMTKQEELRVAQRVGTKLFIVRKLRRRLEYATGGNAEKWREKDVRDGRGLQS